MKTLLLASLVAAAILAHPGLAHGAPPPEIRVLVMDDLRSATIDGLGFTLELRNPLGRTERDLGTKIAVAAKGPKLMIGGQPVDKEIMISSRSKEYMIEGKSFFGELAIVWKSDGKLMVINHLPLERYLIGIVGSEISPRWPIESIKAQVVAARTYALNKIDAARKSQTKKPFDITSTILSQVYHGAHVEDARAKQAVMSTQGEILYRNGSIFPAYYHSCCGGQTEYAHNVWEGETGPPVAADPFCKRSPKFSWKYEIPISEFVSRLSENAIPIHRVISIGTTPFPDSPRVEYLLVEDDLDLKMIKATDLRRVFGYTDIKSTWFDAELKGDRIVFAGKGYGHGVGMCQWGAKAMAESGLKYTDILKHYYSDSIIGKAY